MSRRSQWAGVFRNVIGDVAPDADLLDAENLNANFGLWTTPGTEDPENAWSRRSGPTPTGSTGPNGGANPDNRSVELQNNGYAFTEASELDEISWSLEGPEMDASLGTSFLTFDVHMRFGSEGGIDTGVLRPQGWNGAAWSNIGPAITGSQQVTANTAYLASSTFGVYSSEGFSNDDFRFRFLFTRGDASSVNFDCAVDNLSLFGPEDAINDPVVVVPPDPSNDREASFNTGLRRLHISQNGTPPLDGSTPDLSFTNLQTALNAVQAGDVLTIGAGTFTGSFDLDNANGSVGNPIWIAAEVIGDVIISNYLQAVKNGTQNWTNDGNGQFSISGSRPYTAFDFEDELFLPGHRNVGDINDNEIPTVVGANNPSGSIFKPRRGFGFSNGRIRLRLEGNANPNGRSIGMTNGFNRQQLVWDNADNVILDGLLFEGAGDSFSVVINSNCANPTVRNCVFDGCQFGIRTNADNTNIEFCEYLTSGMETFQLELRALNGQGTNAAFRYAKNYYTASIVGGNDADALLEGGLDTDVFNTSNPAQNVVISDCYAHSCFDGTKAGRHGDGTIVERCAFEACLDDGIEWETPQTPLGESGVGETRECLFLNCFSPLSYSGDFNIADHFCYRNVVVIDDLDLVHPPFLFKMIKTPTDVDIQVYHNTFINVSANGDSNEGFGTNHWVWFGFGNSTGNRIRNFYNNIVGFPNDLDQPNTGGTQRPNNRENNVVVSPANNGASQEHQGTNGVFAGTNLNDLDLTNDFTLEAGAPAIDEGRSLIGGHPDTRSEAGTRDCGAIPFGELPAFRNPERLFSGALPPRWTSPGV